MAAAYRKVAPTDERAPGAAKPLRVSGTRIALYNSGGTFYAIGDACTHAGGGIRFTGQFDGEYSAPATAPNSRSRPATR